MNYNKIKIPINKKHVIEVSAHLFFEKGYGYTSMDDVSQVSGVSKSNIYYHFKGKEELLEAVIDYWSNYYRQLVEQAIYNTNTSVESRIISFLEELTSEISNRGYKGSCPFITLYMQSPMEPDVSKRKITFFFKRLEPAFVNLFQQGIDSGEFRGNIPAESIGNLFLSTMEGALLLSEITQDNKNTLTAATNFCKMLY